jgi:hypothetical protein
MHVHLPKPLHGWRAFVGEVGIIVIGVLIALSAEQLVEWVHWQAKVGGAETAIGRDLALQSDLASERVALKQCNDDRLAILRSAILSTGDRWTTVLPPTTDGVTYHVPYSAPVRLWNTQLWDSLVADGTVAHFSLERARTYALLYDTIRLLAADNQHELDTETALKILGDRNVPFTPDAKIALIRTIDDLSAKNVIIASTSRQILRRIQDSGHLPTVADTKRRLSDPSSHALECRFADAALNARVAENWFTLHR